MKQVFMMMTMRTLMSRYQGAEEPNEDAIHEDARILW
jgi:hypothetical protein